MEILLVRAEHSMAKYKRRSATATFKMTLEMTKGRATPLKKTLMTLGLFISLNGHAASLFLTMHTFLANSRYAICFTPGGHCTDLMVTVLASAKQSIDVQAYSFTSRPIANALIQAQKRGVKVNVLLDKSNLRSKYSVIQLLVDKHIPCLLD